jgi:hypothetical protein
MKRFSGHHTADRPEQPPSPAARRHANRTTTTTPVCLGATANTTTYAQA